jgi:hypothetical protein
MAIDTIRVVAANANWLKNNRDVAARFLKANWKGLLFHYALSDRAVERYSKHWNIDPQDTRRGPEFSPLANQTYQPFGNLEALERTAIELKMLREPLTAEQKKELFDFVWESPPLPPRS